MFEISAGGWAPANPSGGTSMFQPIIDRWHNSLTTTDPAILDARAAISGADRPDRSDTSDDPAGLASIIAGQAIANGDGSDPGLSVGGSGQRPKIDYLNADLAQHYKMNNATAYQEALENTAYQRAVKDLQAAGLNPVLAMGKVSPAGSFSGQDYVSGSGGGISSARGTSAARKNANLSPLVKGVSAVVSAVAGSTAGTIAQGIGNIIDYFF